MASNDLWKNLQLKESLLRQKLRLKWLKEGDQKTKYFHHVIKERRMRTNLAVVQTGKGSSVEDVIGIRNEVVKVFKGRFKEGLNDKPSLGELGFNQLS